MSKLTRMAKLLVKATNNIEKPNNNTNFPPNNNINHNNQNSSTNFISRGGISFNYPKHYLIANIPPNTPDCVVALAKDDGLCDIMVEVSKYGKINYQEDIFEKNYEEYIKGLGFYGVKVIDGFGLNRTCLQALANTPQGIIKSTIYFDFNLKKDIRITLNTLMQVNYDCTNDLKVIANSLHD